MRAIGYVHSLPIAEPQSLFDFEAPDPRPAGRDLLVEVRAIAVNPVDTKVRMRRQGTEDEPVILGWDAAGVVRSVGREVRLFKPGDEVFYAGNVLRPGSNAELQAVDERIVGRKPKSLGFAEAAALPLTSITAWEALFDRLHLPISQAGTEKTLLIVGGAGGVGSIATQLARTLTQLVVIATASRPETRAWVESLGAHHVIDHSKPLSEELKRIGVGCVDAVFGTTQTDRHWTEIVASLKPQGQVCLIDDPAQPLDVMLLKPKSLTLAWEMMFTRSTYQTADMDAQHRLLSEVSRLVDTGLLRTTLGENYGRIAADNLKRAHATLESGRAIGKLVLEGW